MRRARAVWACAAGAALAVALAGCSHSAPAAETDSAETTGAAPPRAEVAVETAEDMQAYLAHASKGATWLAGLVRVEKRKKLGSPVFELHFSGEPETVAPVAREVFRILQSGEATVQAWVEVWADGGVVAGAGVGTPVERDLPPPPEDIEQLREWLARVYGPGGLLGEEWWYGRIESVELGESAAKKPLISVRTSIPADGERAFDDAQLIVLAIASAHPTFANEVEVWFADEKGLVSGSTETYNPYVY
ncbi:MAG: hypothetical protein Kow0056_13350 [Coriobacteriia bacterium]